MRLRIFSKRSRARPEPLFLDDDSAREFVPQTFTESEEKNGLDQNHHTGDQRAKEITQEGNDQAGGPDRQWQVSQDSRPDRGRCAALQGNSGSQNKFAKTGAGRVAQQPVQREQQSGDDGPTMGIMANKPRTMAGTRSIKYPATRIPLSTGIATDETGCGRCK